MSRTSAEIQRREQVALAAVKKVFGTDEDKFGATLFVSHHLDEIDASYWLKYFPTDSPEHARVLDILQLRSHWGGNDEIDVFDFTLPDDVTNYVISVRFNNAGAVERISMES